VTSADTHAHVFHRELNFIPNRRYTPDYDAFPEQYLAMLDANGMSHGVIVPISILGTDNSHTVEALERVRNRLRGIAVVDPATDLDKVSGLDASGIAGIRMNLIGLPVPDVRAPSRFIDCPDGYSENMMSAQSTASCGSWRVMLDVGFDVLLSSASSDS
jgi:predicted TIM-barrel fold metal-dependent hydrolase